MSEENNNLKSFVFKVILLLCFVFLLSQILLTIFSKSDFHLAKKDKVYKSLLKKSSNYKLGFEPKSKFWTVIDGKRVDLNSLGLRSAEPYSRDEIQLAIQEGKTHYSILVLGDEVAFGWKLNEEDVFTYALKEALKDKYPSLFVELINSGIPAYSNIQQVEFFLSKLKLLDPDSIVWLYSPKLSKTKKNRIKALNEIKKAVDLLANYLHESYLNSPKRMKIFFVIDPLKKAEDPEFFSELGSYVRSKNFDLHYAFKEEANLKALHIGSSRLLNKKAHKLLANNLLHII